MGTVRRPLNKAESIAGLTSAKKRKKKRGLAARNIAWFGYGQDVAIGDGQDVAVRDRHYDIKIVFDARSRPVKSSHSSRSPIDTRSSRWQRM